MYGKPTVKEELTNDMVIGATHSPMDSLSLYFVSVKGLPSRWSLKTLHSFFTFNDLFSVL